MDDENGPPVSVISAEEICTMPQSATITGRDGGDSSMAWGKSIWAYGDTVLKDADVKGHTWHHNSFSFTNDVTASDGIGGFEEFTDDAGAPAYYVPPTSEEEAFNDAHQGENCEVKPCGARWAVWAGAPVFDQSRDRALILYSLIYAAPGDMNFHSVGFSVAVWNGFEKERKRPVLSSGHEHPTLLFFEGEPEFGNGHAVVKGVLHAFACRQDAWDHECILGRVGLADILDRNRWRYWDGVSWSTDYEKAIVLFPGAPIMSVQHNDYLDLWTIVYSDPVSDDVVMRTANALTGPWSDEVVLFTADHGSEEGWTYDANQHAEYAEENGRVIYITHTRPTGEGWFDSEVVLWRVEIQRKTQ